MIMLNLRKAQGDKKKHNLGEWELYFIKKKLYLKDEGVKQQCLAITDFDENTIKIYAKQSIEELQNSLRHEFIHIATNYKEEKNICDEEFTCLIENLINYADYIIKKWFAEEV